MNAKRVQPTSSETNPEEEQNPSPNPEDQPMVLEPEEKTPDIPEQDLESLFVSPAEPSPAPANPQNKSMGFAQYLSKKKDTVQTIKDYSPGQASQSQADKFILELAKIAFKTKAPTVGQFNDAKLAFCELVQLGAVSSRFDKKRTSSLSVVPISVSDLQSAMNKVDGNLTMRKLARTLRSDILLVAQKWSIPGNLSKRFLLDHPHADMSQQVWASDFHTFTDDESIPSEVYDWLLKNYNDRWGKRF